MADQHRLSPDALEKAIPLLRNMLSAHTEPDHSGDSRVGLRIAHFPDDTPQAERKKVSNLARGIPYMFEPHQATSIEDSTGITLYVEREQYDAALRPARQGEPVDDRLHRLLDYCGHRGLSAKLKRQALDAAIDRFGRGDM
ncbi:MAG: hypothetical protein AB7L92_07510 [Alphaproteobacteria bacterium]